MTDPEAPTRSNGAGDGKHGAGAGEGGDEWVSGDRWSPRRVPGIHDVPETTYVDAPPRVLERRTMIVAGAIVLASLAIGAGFVVAAGSKNDGAVETEVSAAATLTSTSTRPSGTTTTSTLPVTGGNGSAGGDGSGGGDGGSGPSPSTPPATSAPARAPAVSAPISAASAPPATANPAFDPYVGVSVPAGVSASLGPCGWNDGQLYASGNIAGHDSAVRTWTLTVVWLQNNRELARTSTSIPVAPGEVKDWNLSLGQGAPPDLACALEVS